MRLRILLVFTLLLLTACARTAPNKLPSLTVFAAASLSEPFTAIGKQFEQEHPGLTINFNFAGSQQLSQQLAQGAPADVFASANQSYMDQAVAEGIVSADSWHTFARNQLVVIFPIEMPLKGQGLPALAQPGLHVLLAAPEVPAGQYALQFLDKASLDPALGPAFRADVLANVVSYEDNVKAVVAKLALGAADAGIVYTSDVAGENTAKFGQITIPPELNVTATYPIAPLLDSAQPELAQALVDFILSPDGQAILANYGFLPAEP